MYDGSSCSARHSRYSHRGMKVRDLPATYGGSPGAFRWKAGTTRSMKYAEDFAFFPSQNVHSKHWFSFYFLSSPFSYLFERVSNLISIKLGYKQSHTPYYWRFLGFGFRRVSVWPFDHSGLRQVKTHTGFGFPLWFVEGLNRKASLTYDEDNTKLVMQTGDKKARNLKESKEERANNRGEKKP